MIILLPVTQAKSPGVGLVPPSFKCHVQSQADPAGPSPALSATSLWPLWSKPPSVLTPIPAGFSPLPSAPHSVPVLARRSDEKPGHVNPAHAAVKPRPPAPGYPASPRSCPLHPRRLSAPAVGPCGCSGAPGSRLLQHSVHSVPSGMFSPGIGKFFPPLLLGLFSPDPFSVRASLALQAQSSGFPLLTLLSPLLGRLSFLSAWIWNTGCFVICFSGERVSSGEEDTLGSQLRPQRPVQGGHGVNAQQRSGGMSPLPLLCYQRLGQSFRLRGYPDWGACPHPGSRVPGHQLLVQMTSFALSFPSCKWAGGWRKPL